MAIQVTDPLEKQLPPPGSYGFTDGDKAVTVNTQSKELRKQYRLRFLDHQERIKQQLASMAIPLIELNTDESVSDKLNASLGLNARAKR